MNARVRKSARLVRVRTIQHGMAAMVAEKAVRQLESLETNARKLCDLRDGFGVSAGPVTGDTLASMAEMAMRLDLARMGLERPLANARANAQTCRDLRLVAWRNQTSAERLTEKAVKEAERLAEKRRPQRSAPRRAFGGEE